ncbi:hypothetical protein CMK19_00600 [Candidatus Poribacteria bacterium]|nr:hypothetical protein [Candidatus Poribacteria bacterium]|tara:strand:- start:582 stop:836 length:255 start_codon:yes stop_codon:yes gene_type:complete
MRQEYLVGVAEVDRSNTPTGVWEIVTHDEYMDKPMKWVKSHREVCALPNYGKVRAILDWWIDFGWRDEEEQTPQWVLEFIRGVK